MLSCLKTELDGEVVRSDLEENFAQCKDFSSFVSLLVRHRVLVSVYHVLLDTRLLPLLDDSVRSDMVSKVKSLQMRQMQGVAALIEITRAFCSKGIECLCLKGPVLSQLIYGDPIRRHFGDLDLLVRREDLREAYGVLETLGYGASNGAASISRSEDDPIWDFLYHSHFQKGDQQIELHWRISRNDGLYDVSLEMLFERKQAVLFAGNVFYTLGSWDLGAYLTVHGTSHAWSRLKWLYDLKCLSRTFSEGTDLPVDKPLVDRVGRLRNELILLLWPVNSSVLGNISVLGRFCIYQLTTENDDPSGLLNMVRRSITLFTLSKGTRGKLASLMTLLVWPPVYERISLSRKFSFLYPLVGPFFWAIDKVKSVRR